MIEVSPTWLGETMLRLLECSRQALEDDGDRAPELVHLVPGLLPAWDNCCESGGQLYVRTLRFFPSGEPFPALYVQRGPLCPPPMTAAVLGVGVIRCTPTLGDDGEPPSAQDMTASALEITRDSHVLMQTIICCLKEAPGVQKAVLGEWTPQGADGGCAGGEWTVTVGLPSCADCD